MQGTQSRDADTSPVIDIDAIKALKYIMCEHCSHVSDLGNTYAA